MSDTEMSTAYAMMSSDCYECPDGPVFEAPAVKPATNKAPKAPKAKASNTKSSPTYRQKQRFVKWMRENDYWKPARKNVGTANVNANVEAILDSDRFWALMTRPDLVASLNTFVGYDVV